MAKAMRIYMNMSKRKTQSKREAAKTVLLELITAAKLEMPEDFMETLSHFDDEELTDQPQSAGSVNENVAELLTAEAQVLWQRLRDAGFIVADGYALAEGVSANQAAYIADRMAEKLRHLQSATCQTSAFRPRQFVAGLHNHHLMSAAKQAKMQNHQIQRG